MPRRIVVALIGLTMACESEGLDPAALADPSSCQSCHPDQAREWSGSMHAYASDDPVFLAMQALGQRDTGGALGDFCVRCHAPFAARLFPGEDLASVPRWARGVTCAACHQIEEVTALHNGGLRWADDRIMRGAMSSPVETPAHGSAASALLDVDAVGSSEACGACHDVVTPGGVAVERTYAEWAESIFARPDVGLSCGACHMPGREAPAALGGPLRRVHDHGMAAVDVALTPWPGGDEQRLAIARDLAGVLAVTVCARPGGGAVMLDVSLDNIGAGHAFPSGVTHARRVWVEVIAEQEGVTTYQRGVFAPGEVVASGGDPEVWVLGSRFLDGDGEEVEHVWDAAAIDGELLATAVTLDPTDPRYYHAVTRTYTIAGAPDTIRVRVRMQPLGLELLDPLIAAGELSASVRDAVPTFDLASTAKQWLRERDGWGCAP